MSVVSDTLREARQARRISLNQAALETRIRQSILEALEEGDYAALPPRPFLRGLLRNYAVYLNLDADSLMDAYDAETGGRPARRIPPASEPAGTGTGIKSAPPLSGTPSSGESTSGELPFPPFQIPTGTRPNTTPEALPEGPVEPEYHVAPEDAEDSQPTAPLNLSQEPPTFGQRIGSTRIPEIVAILALGVTLFFLVSIGFTQVQQFITPLASQATPRPSLTASATVPPGSTPTGIPTLPQTIVPPTLTVSIAPTLPISQTATVISTTETISATESATPDLPIDTVMTLDIQANGQVGVWVIADEDTVFNGTLQNETRSYTARSRLFVQIKNIENGRVFFQGTRILPRDQQERSELNRAWLVNPLGTPVIIPPTPHPSPVTPTSPPTATPSATATPTVTGTPTGTPTPSTTPSPTATPTSTATSTATGTATRTGTVTQTGTFTRTATASATPTATGTPTRTGTPTPTRTNTPTPTPTPTS